MTLRFLSMLAFILVFVIAGAKLYPGAAWFAGNFPLIVLIVSSAFLGGAELACIALIVAFLMNWQAAFSWDIALFIILPLACLALRRLTALRAIFGSVVLTLASLVVFYGIISWRAVIASPVLSVKIIGADMVFALLVSLLFNFIYAKHPSLYGAQ